MELRVYHSESTIMQIRVRWCQGEPDLRESYGAGMDHKLRDGS